MLTDILFALLLSLDCTVTEIAPDAPGGFETLDRNPSVLFLSTETERAVFFGDQIFSEDRGNQVSDWSECDTTSRDRCKDDEKRRHITIFPAPGYTKTIDMALTPVPATSNPEDAEALDAEITVEDLDARPALLARAKCRPL